MVFALVSRRRGIGRLDATTTPTSGRLVGAEGDRFRRIVLDGVVP